MFCTYLHTAAMAVVLIGNELREVHLSRRFSTLLDNGDSCETLAILALLVDLSGIHLLSSVDVRRPWTIKIDEAFLVCTVICPQGLLR